MSPSNERLAQFCLDYQNAYPQEISLQSDSCRPGFVARNLQPYIDCHRHGISSTIENGGRNVLGKAFLSEWVARLALLPLFKDSNLDCFMAPQTLEAGIRPIQKGVDILITNRYGLVYAGIDVKIGSKKQRFGFSSTTKSPFFILSFVNCHPNNQTFDDWLSTSVAPNIVTTGQFPHMDQIRMYSYRNLYLNISHYINLIVDHCRGDMRNTNSVPKDIKDKKILLNKLETLIGLF